MRFIHPEFLWALLLLLVPLIIHLFRLRRFKNTPFTNVPFLKEVVAESRKSKSLKKLLLLITRMALLACLVFAFARPYLQNPDHESTTNLMVYLDNSRSMEHPGTDGSLLQQAVNDLLRTDNERELTLLTNDQEFRNVRLSEIRNDLLDLNYSENPLNPKEMAVRLRRLQGSEKNYKTLIISDFQDTAFAPLSDYNPDFVILRPVEIRNISIDTAWITGNESLSIRLSRSGNYEETPVSLYDRDTLIARAAVEWLDAREQELTFTLPEDNNLLGRLQVNDNGLQYDNTLFINLDQSTPTRVLSIGASISTQLSRIYSGEDFDFDQTPVRGINYATLPENDLIILDHIERLPAGLSESLLEFRKDGGTVVIIPGAGMETSDYRQILSYGNITALGELRNDSLSITSINFDHPVFQDVFESRVENFAYPRVSAYYPVRSRSALLSFQGNIPFLTGENNMFFFAAPLTEDYSNFTSSPLIVPVFYALGKNSRKTGNLYYQSGKEAALDIPVQLSGDKILSIRSESSEFIPKQQNFTNKTRLDLSGITPDQGHYQVTQGTQELGYLSFNVSREESDLTYPAFEAPGRTVYSSVREAFQQYEKNQSLDELWKWFVILALLFLLAETAIQKFMK